MDTRQVAHELRLGQWETVLRERKASGLSVRRWCRENDVNEKTYYYWQRKLRETICESMRPASSRSLVPATFAQVRLPDAPAAENKLIIRLNGAEVEIHGEMPASTVEAVVRALACR